MEKKCQICKQLSDDINHNGLCDACSSAQYVPNKNSLFDQYYSHSHDTKQIPLSNNEVPSSNFFLESLHCLITVRIPSLMSEIYNRGLIKITYSPKAFSKVKSKWANEALSKLSAKKQFDILNKMDTISAWRILRTKPMPIMIELLKMMQKDKVSSILMFESMTQRERISSQVWRDLGEIKDKEDVIPLKHKIPLTHKEKNIDRDSNLKYILKENNGVEEHIETNNSVKTDKISEVEATKNNIQEKENIANEVVCRDSIIKCDNCEEIIGKLEIAYKFKDYSVCHKCYQRLNV
jgi:hypothetical protein